MKQKFVSLKRVTYVAIVVGYSAILLLLFSMDWILISSYQKNLQQREEEQFEKYIEQIENDMRELTKFAYDIYSDNIYFQALSGRLSELEAYNNAYELNDLLSKKVMREDGLHAYCIFYSNTVRYFYDNNEVSFDGMQFLKEYFYQEVSTDNKWEWNYVDTGEGQYETLVCKKNEVAVGLAFRLPDMDMWVEENMESEADILLFQKSQVYGDEELARKIKLQEHIKNGQSNVRYTAEGYRVYARKINGRDLWICTAVHLGFGSFLNGLHIVLLLITVGAFVAALVTFRFIRRKMLLPLRELTDVMNRIREGDWEVKVKADTTFSEIREVEETFITMLTEVRHQQIRSYEETSAKHKAQMQYLQLQLKPHFYLNGLKMLNVLAMDGENERMQELIMNLSEHMRYLLQSDCELVSLRSEANHTENYIRLRKNITGRKCDVIWTIAEEIEEEMVPTLCIQTFVENSFKYAKHSQVGEKLIIHISASLLETEEGNFLNIRVRDNGNGYDEKILEEINDNLPEGRGVGIHNLKQRCKILYDNRVEFFFYNDGGAVSEFIMALEERKEETGEDHESRAKEDEEGKEKER